MRIRERSFLRSFKNIVIKSFAMGYVPEIPDIALDKHTTRGQEMDEDQSISYMKQVKLSRKQK